MNGVKINYDNALDILKEIVRRTKSIEEKIENVINNVNSIDKENIWICDNATEYKKVFMEKLNLFNQDVEILNNVIIKLTYVLESYNVIDKQILDNLRGGN